MVAASARGNARESGVLIFLVSEKYILAGD